ncbi:hypothetical protein CAPTEDRAFT_150733 [Capitella teleta]|uniref:Ricin B lectin domain-containing protein n=1 Tax=Capitella teleta TaxID=283909 RepID=R7VBT2_CAPTE|nr:hypothetical protein CAPTEDRAFT_150733 [Capitella teleta]|eukprot:ELU13756.1 hypothetical protein CAPTEDRAFT_150733 [Capitella teleta]
MSEGKFFYIRSKLSNLVLEIEDGIAQPGQRVTTGRSNYSDHQLWYEDQFNQCIRSKKADNLCLEMKGDDLIVGNFEPDEYQQRWKIHNDKIEHCEEEDTVLDIADCCQDEGARICSYGYNGGDNQCWNIEHVPPQYCYIVSKMNGRVIDVKNGSMDPGTKIVMWSKKDGDNDNQHWYEDKYGYIHAKINGFVFDSAEGSLRLQEYDPTLDTRKWIKNGQKIVNKADPDIVVDIKGGDSSKGAKLQGWEYKVVDNQHWTFEYI